MTPNEDIQCRTPTSSRGSLITILPPQPISKIRRSLQQQLLGGFFTSGVFSPDSVPKRFQANLLCRAVVRSTRAAVLWLHAKTRRSGVCQCLVTARALHVRCGRQLSFDPPDSGVTSCRWQYAPRRLVNWCIEFKDAARTDPTLLDDLAGHHGHAGHVPRACTVACCRGLPRRDMARGL